MRTFFMVLWLAVVAVSGCAPSPPGITEQEKDELVVVGMCGFWHATMNDSDASDEERRTAEDSWSENACESRLEGLLEGSSLVSSSTTQGDIASEAVDGTDVTSEKTEAGAVAYVSSPASVSAFSERFAGLFDGPVQGLEARLVGDCAGVRFESEHLKEIAEELNDEYEPWTMFIRWTAAGWEPAAVGGNPDVWSVPDANFEFYCADLPEP